MINPKKVLIQGNYLQNGRDLRFSIQGMERIISLLTPLSVETRPKPMDEKMKPKEKIKKLMRAYEEAKMFKEYQNVAQCLFWIGEEQFDRKIRKYLGGHMLAQAKKIYSLCKDHPEWIGYMSRVTIKDWKRTNISEVLRYRERVRRVLDGARTYVGEDVDPQPSNPQQESAVTAAAAWDELTWTAAEDQFLFQGPETESRDSEAIQAISNPSGTEDLGRTWDDLMGISEDIPENHVLTE